MRTIFKLLLIVFLSVISTGAIAQGGYDVSGTVTNEKGEPLKGATVFIGGSEKIMPTTDDGRFRFTHVSPGTFTLSVTMVGYTPLTRHIIVRAAPLSIDMRLQTKAISLNEVVIGSQRAFDKNLEVFKQQFLGWSRNGNQCVILNPKVIHFSTKKNLLLANADEFLIIENKRLGYRIRYLLQDFGYNEYNRTTLYHGESSFEELEGTAAQKKEWAKNRAETYKGSVRHFLRSVYANNTLENGFIAKQLVGYGRYHAIDPLLDPDRLIVINQPVKFDTLITAIDSNFISVKFKQLYIVYDPKKAAVIQLEALKKNIIIQPKNTIFNDDASLLRMSANQALIDKKGSYTDYRDFFIKGYWAQARVGDELPVDYISPMAVVPRGNIPVNKPAFALQAWTDQNPQEKTYLHMDKPYYALGDTIWFKGYLTTGSRHQLSTLSGAFYIDLVNEQNKLVKTLKLPVDQGTVAGNLILSEDITAGSYRVRAYTRWMRNAGEDYFFDKTFTIGKPAIIAPNKNGLLANLQQTDVQFFPEGGNLVNGITSRVGFKAIGADGLGQVISGTITDNDNNEVAIIHTLHAGMGNFSLKPLPGKSYTANIKLADNTIKNIALPEALSQGYVLSVYQPNKDSVLLRIQASANLQHSTINLIVHSSGELISTTPVVITGAVTSVWLDKRSFPSGIAQFTIFDANGEPLNERIAFIKNTDQMQLAIKTQKAIFKTREHVQLELNATDNGGAPVAANFSAAVINQNMIPVDESAESTIFSNILLTSDIKGYIEKPNYYFMADTDLVNKALDNLMLTQGYRRFEWKSVTNTINTKPLIVTDRLDPNAALSFKLIKDEPQKVNVLISTASTKPTFAAEGVGVTISGLVTTLTHKPLPNANVLLISLNARIRKITTTDDNGRFKFDSLMFADSARFAVQARDAKNSDKVVICIDTLPKIIIKAKPNLADVSIIQSILKKAEDDGYPVKLTGPNVLKQVNIKATKYKPEEIATQGMMKLMDEESADRILTIPDPENYPNLEMFLQGRMGSISVQMNPVTGYKQLMSSRRDISVATEKVEPLGVGAVLNGRPLGPDELNDVLTGGVQPEDVAKILLVTHNLAALSALSSGDGTGGGVLLILTKPISARKQYNPAIANIQPKGYNAVRQFYSPRYNRPNDSQLPDLRTTIHWDPYVNTDANGKATLDFYNADGPGTYRVVIEGINAGGELGRQVFTYKVE
jgi:hypothetical protein